MNIRLRSDLDIARPINIHRHGTMVGVANVVVGDDDVIDRLAGSIHQDRLAGDVLETAVGDAQIIDAAANADGRIRHVGVAPGGLRQVPVGIGEAEGQTGDGDMAHAAALDQVELPSGLNLGGIGVAVARQTHVKPAALAGTGALLVKPELAGGIEVLRLILQVVTVVGVDLLAVSEPDALEDDPLLGRVVSLDSLGNGVPMTMPYSVRTVAPT